MFSYSFFLSAYLLYRAVSPVSTIVQYNPGKALVMEASLLQSLCKVAQNQYANFFTMCQFRQVSCVDSTFYTVFTILLLAFGVHKALFSIIIGNGIVPLWACAKRFDSVLLRVRLHPTTKT